MSFDPDALIAKGWRVAVLENGAKIAPPEQRWEHAAFVPMKDGELDLMPNRSSFHRRILVALGEPVTTPDGAAY